MYPFAFIPATRFSVDVFIFGNTYIADDGTRSWYCCSILESDIHNFNLSNDYQL